MNGWTDPCGLLNQQAVCNNANGLPTSPISQTGTDAPENNVTGYLVGGHFYYRTTTNKLYVFGGTPREKTGWQILN